MRAQKRRLPAERVRHAKRLGHVQQGSGPAFPAIPPADKPGDPPKPATTTSTTTVPTQITLPTVTPVTHSSSASASTPSSPASTSPTTPLTSSVASSTNGQSTTATTMPISSFTSQGSSIPTLATSTTSSLATTTPFTNVAAAKSNGLSGGAIAGIIAGAVVVGVALIMFFVRKTALRRREHKRISWSGAPGVAGGVFAEPKLAELSEKPVSFSAASGSRGGSPMSPFEAHGQSMYTTPPPPVVHMQTPNIPYAPPAPPQATFNNPTQAGRYPTFAPGNTGALAVAGVAASTPVDATVPPMRGPQAPVETTVKCTYVPSLPDELSITTGERIRVVARYDDGWALCANARGEQGMVPQECLDVTSSVDWGNGRRLSSLNADGRPY